MKKANWGVIVHQNVKLPFFENLIKEKVNLQPFIDKINWLTTELVKLRDQTITSVLEEIRNNGVQDLVTKELVKQVDGKIKELKEIDKEIKQKLEQLDNKDQGILNQISLLNNLSNQLNTKYTKLNEQLLGLIDEKHLEKITENVNKINQLITALNTINSTVQGLKSNVDLLSTKYNNEIKKLDEKIKNIDMSNYATKSELGNYVNKTQINEYAKKSELTGFANKTELNSYATKLELDEYGKKSDIINTLNNYASKNELNELASKSELNNYMKKDEANSIHQTYNTKLNEKANLSHFDSYYKKDETNKKYASKTEILNPSEKKNTSDMWKFFKFTDSETDWEMSLIDPDRYGYISADYYSIAISRGYMGFFNFGNQKPYEGKNVNNRFLFSIDENTKHPKIILGNLEYSYVDFAKLKKMLDRHVKEDGEWK